MATLQAAHAPASYATAVEVDRFPTRGDLWAILAIAAAYLVAVVAMPPQRDFAYVDDWNFYQQTQRILSGQGFAPSDFAQMTMVTHAYWGALFGYLFGLSLTTATFANLAMSFIPAVTFYVLLRRVGLGYGLSLLGVALLAANPFFLSLSYSFMTDVTFTATVLLACLFYYEGLRREGASGVRWLPIYAQSARSPMTSTCTSNLQCCKIWVERVRF
jgi:4-amino-4-deoxy-L-arabinose transferase-like glycosyltransferase